MYTSHFKLRENPFSLTPDPKYLFLSRQHREALNHLIYGIKEKKGFIVITGGIGTGKTTLSRALLAGMDPYVETALIFNSYLSDMELLEVINQEFKVSLVGVDRTKRRYIDSLNAFLMSNYQAGKNAVVLIDEAQNLSRNVLEQIRMLSNLETETEKLLQIVLVGQPELRDLLAQPSLKQLTERISVRYHLDALSRDDVPDYIGHRLAVSGDTGHLKFADDAFGKIYDFSRGNPRRINILCDRAMLIAYAGNLLEIDRKVIKLAVKDLKSSDVKKGTFFARAKERGCLPDKPITLVFLSPVGEDKEVRGNNPLQRRNRSAHERHHRCPETSPESQRRPVPALPGHHLRPAAAQGPGKEAPDPRRFPGIACAPGIDGLFAHHLFRPGRDRGARECRYRRPSPFGPKSMPPPVSRRPRSGKPGPGRRDPLPGRAQAAAGRRSRGSRDVLSEVYRGRSKESQRSEQRRRVVPAPTT